MRTALVLIVLINDLIHPDGAMPTCAVEVERRGVLAAANLALEGAPARGWPTLLVKVGIRAGYPELPAHAPLLGRARELGVLRLGQWGTEFHADLAVQPADPVLVKHPAEPLPRRRPGDAGAGRWDRAAAAGGRQHRLGAAVGGPGGP
ncbi:isochorismatase family protein [Synechococcus sp. CS-1332]|uniref:isochorismatase family protein n=1 Tax=Synechococcus sp. CS-1332 TaxID=2847972 RepID=UPI00223C26E4|nr:isochorismatase family protein [Synechococcus sp. CS-1332]